MVQLYKRKGDDILVNTTTLNNQSGGNIALLAGGGFVVTWTDSSLTGGDTTGSAIRAQRFDANGNRVGGEFVVNTTTLGNQSGAVVAGLPSGRFVVTWTDASATGGDTSSNAVRGRIFEADGTPVGGEFLVNTATTNSQSAAVITELSSGGFVVTWRDSSGIGGDTSGTGIKAQIFDADGVRVGSEFLVNMTTAGGQGASGLGMTALPGGGFAIVYSTVTSVSGQPLAEVRFQRFDALGARVGAEQLVNTNPDGNLLGASIAALATGFVVTWAQQDSAQANGVILTFNVHGQIYDAAGVKVGAEFIVNTTTAGTQDQPDIDTFPGGGFLVTWTGDGPGSSSLNIYGQMFDDAGVKIGPEFVVNSALPGDQFAPRVEVLPSGEIAVIYTDSLGFGDGPGDGSGSGVRIQILIPTTEGPSDISISGPAISETALEGLGLVTLSATGAINGAFTYEILSDSSGGAFRVEGDRLVVDDNSLLDFETRPQVELLIRATDANGNSYEEVVQLQIADTPEGTYLPAGGEFLVNTSTQNNQTEITLTALAGGGFVAIWPSWTFSGGNPVTKAQIYDAHGVAIGGELTIGDALAAAALPNGGFVVVGNGPDGQDTGIVVRFYDASGASVGSPIVANTTLPGDQAEPSITVLASGGFVVAWTDYNQLNPGVLRAQVFDATGAKVGNESVVPLETYGSAVELSALADGRFVAVWQGQGIEAQIFTPTGQFFGPPLQVINDNYIEPHVAGLAGGGFVVVYARNLSSGPWVGIGNLTAQLFDADGVPIGDAFEISSGGPQQVYSIDVAATAWGGFVVTWAEPDVEPNPDGTSNADTRMQVFDATGAVLSPQILVNEVTRDDQIQQSITVLASGDIVIGWTDSVGQVGSPGSSLDVKARIFTFEENISGPTPGPDTLTGTESSDTLFGLGGDDILNGLGGNDLLDGGAGADRMTGGTGNDIYTVDNAADQVIEAVGEGNDAVYTEVSYVLGTGQSVEVLSARDSNATTALSLFGNELGNGLVGNNGANYLDGGAGADVMTGFGGDDVYTIDNAGDVVVEELGGGYDTIYTSFNYVLGFGASVEVLSARDSNATDALNLFGNELNNGIIGNNGANYLDGQAGADVMTGFGGDDVYTIDNAGDVVVEEIGGGYDTIYTSFNYVLGFGASVEVLSARDSNATDALSLFGNELDNGIIGNNGANYLDGQAGADVMTGFGGDDTYVVDNAGDVVVEELNGGNDTIYTSFSYQLGVGASVEVLASRDNSATVAMDLLGNELDNTIFGNNGVNNIDGAIGADDMVGFGGDDVYTVDNALDQIYEGVGGGNDSVFAATSYTLSAGREVEVLAARDNSATTALNLAGNEQAQYVMGSNGANILDGGGGADVLVGYGGADIFAFTTAIGTGTGNADIIADFVSGTDRIALDDAMFTGLAPGALAAGAFVTGSAAADADDRIVYDAATGRLYYDADGNGAGAAILFATLQGNPALAAGDFTVI